MEFFKQGQRRIDDAEAWAVGAADLFFDCLDDLVTVPRFLGDEMKNDQAQVAMREGCFGSALRGGIASRHWRATSKGRMAASVRPRCSHQAKNRAHALT